MSKAAELAALIGSQTALSNRNIIINGAMNVAQRGTSSTGIGASSGYFTVDRFQSGHSGNSAGRYTMTQEAITDLGGFNNAIKLACTTADTSIASNEWEYIAYNIEAQDLQRLKFGTSDAKKFTLSFFVKGNASATYTLGAYSVDSNRWMAQTFSVTTSFTRVSLTWEADTTGTIDDDNGPGLVFYITLQAGSDKTSGSIPSTWETFAAADTADSGQTQFFDSTSRTLFITGVQMEIGEVATPFEHRTFADDLAACERYYQIAAPLAGNGNSSNFKTSVSFKTAMRAQPTLSFTDNDFDVTDGHASNYASTDANPSWTYYISHSGGVVGTANHASISGDARRGTMLLNTTDSLLMDSEL